MTTKKTDPNDSVITLVVSKIIPNPIYDSESAVLNLFDCFGGIENLTANNFKVECKETDYRKLLYRLETSLFHIKGMRIILKDIPFEKFVSIGESGIGGLETKIYYFKKEKFTNDIYKEADFPCSVDKYTKFQIPFTSWDFDEIIFQFYLYYIKEIDLRTKN